MASQKLVTLMNNGSMSFSDQPLALDNPFSVPSTLPYGLPDYSKIENAHYEPAIRAGMNLELAEIQQIIDNPAEPSVANTLVPFDLSGEVMSRALTAFYNQISADASDELEDIDQALTADLAAFHDAIYMNEALFARFTRLNERIASGEEPANAAARWLLTTLLKDFQRAGIALPAESQEKLRSINARLTELQSEFGRKLLAGANEASVFIADVSELEGLPADAIDAAAAAADSRDRAGEYLLELQLPTQQSVLSLLARRETRERVFRASMTRGSAGGANDTQSIVLEIVKLRAQAAQLLGYEHHAAYIAEDATAKTTAAVEEILSGLVPAATANARAEAEILEAALRADLGDDSAKLEPWDWQYYAEKVRLEKFALDDSLLRPYLELENVVHKGVFEAAHRLYGLSFVERTELKGYHEDVRVFEVFNEDGSGLGLFLADFYTRESKRGGAWMNNLVDQAGLTGERAVVVNNLNIPKPPAGQQTLLTWDEVITLFHEFGHALHGLFSDVEFPSHSGTEVARDFVEFPSQVNEMWAWEPSLLAQYAVHNQTGESIPQEWIDTLNSSRQFNEGFATTEYLAAAILDQAWHQLTPEQIPTDVLEFEAAALKDAGIALETVPPRYRTTYYNHIFDGGYSAGYYSYIWSEVLDADTVEWFKENGGLKRENGDYFRATLLSRGGEKDSLEVFKDFRGRAQIIEPLLERRGLKLAH